MRSRLLALLILLALDGPVHAQAWKVDTCLFYKLHFTAGDEAAMDGVKALLTGFHQRFHEAAGTDLDFGRSSVDVYLHPPGSSEASPGYASLSGGVHTGVHPPFYQGTLKMPGPAACDGRGRSSIGHPQDRNYFDKLLIHEVSAIYLDFLCRSSGTQFFSLPSWFVQGLEEYFGVFYSTDYWKTDGVRYYYRRLRTAPHGIDTAFGLMVEDVYNDGFLLVHFIAERYGEKAIFEVLLDQGPSPGKRLRAHLPALPRFIEDLEKWKSLKQGQGESADPSTEAASTQATSRSPR